jgi:peptide/nickel transport system substrate-binding protein
VPVKGGRYIEGLIGLPTTLNPLLASTPSERDVTRLLFEGLTWVDGTGRPQPELAESWTTSDDGLRYTFRLRRDVTWHDGEPVTATDVLFTIRLVQSPGFPGNPALSTFWRGIRVDIDDPHTVVFTLLEPFAPFPNYASLPILPAHRLQGMLPEDLAGDPFSLGPVGTGPFRLVSFDREGRRALLARYDGYYARKPYLDEVEFRFYETVDELLAAFRSGEIDGAGILPWEVVARGIDLGADARIYAPLLAGMTALFFNQQTQLFSDERVRQAIALGIDRASLVREVFQGQAEPATGPIPISLWAYGAQPTPVDRERARQLLQAAGWGDSNSDGILDSGGVAFRFTLLVNQDDAQRVAVAHALAAQLHLLGIVVTVQPLPAPELREALLERQYSAAVFGWVPILGDPDCFELWHSSQADNGLNVSGLRNQTVDTLLFQARTTTDLRQRRSLYVEFQRVFTELASAVVLYYPRYFFAVRGDIGGVQPVSLIHPSDRLHWLPEWYKIQE